MSREVYRCLNSFNTYLKLTYNYIQTRVKALNGEAEYIKTKLFNRVDKNKMITGWGKLI